jgi:tetratricopeptide (TPR) repeat protein
MSDEPRPPSIQPVPWLQRQWQRLRQRAWQDVIIGEVGPGASNVIIGKNNIQINVAGRNLSLPVWLIVLALATVAGLLAYPRIEPYFFPSQMTGGINIAIGGFGQLDARGRVRPSALGSAFSQMVFEKLENEYRENYPNLVGKDGKSVQIWHDSQGRDVKNLKFGVLTGATPELRSAQAQRLAERINADIVIYGYLAQNGQEEGLQLEFYYRGDTLRGEPDAITGRHVLGEPVSFPAALRNEPMAVRELLNEPLGLRSRALFWITVALIYDVIDQQDRALATLQKAEQQFAGWDDKAGQALLHYFIGREAFWLREYDTAITALDEAKDLNPTYANVYITLGATYYDRAQLFFLPKPVPENLAQCVSTEHLDRAAQTAEQAMADIDRAIDYSEQAVRLAPNSPWPPIEYPARLQLGHAYRLKGQAYLLAADHELALPWFDKALQEFQPAARAFAARDDQQYLAWTHLGIGTTYQLQAYGRVATVMLADDAATRAAKYRDAAGLFGAAAQEYQQCIDQGAEVADLVWRKKVLDCGCVYYQKLAQDAQAQVEQLIQEQ